MAGAMSMAAGEYASVSSQADTERADLARETRELDTQPALELDELTNIYSERGLEPALAREVARQPMAKDAVAAHSRDELGILAATTARPVQAALTSALMFTAGAALPLLVAVLLPASSLTLGVSAASIAFLALLGGVGARVGGAPVWKVVARVTFRGAIAMAITAGIGAAFGVAA